MPEHIDEESGEVTVAGTVPRTIIAVGIPFTVALTAGVAALRLVDLGRDALITGFGRTYLRADFADARRSCRRSTGWTSSQYRPCNVNAEALLAGALPTSARTLEVTSLSVLPARSSLLTCPTLCVLTPLRYVGSARARRPGP